MAVTYDELIQIERDHIERYNQKIKAINNQDVIEPVDLERRKGYKQSVREAESHIIRLRKRKAKQKEESWP